MTASTIVAAGASGFAPRGNGLVAVTALAAMLVAIGFALRSTAWPPVPAATAQTYGPLLVAAAACCIAGIASRRRPTAAWLAAVLAGAIPAFEMLGVVRFVLPHALRSSWPALVLVASIGLVSAAVIAAAYAVRTRPTRHRSMSVGLPIVAALALLALAGGTVWLVVIALDPSDALSRDDWLPVRVVGRFWLALLVIALLVGAARDLAGPFARAMGRTTATGVRRALSREFAGLLLDELWPSSVESRRRAVEDERSRLAADLHALVLPDLRRAAADAEASVGSTDPVSIRIRSALADVEHLMNARQSVVLEQFGLVAALGWLVERVEERGPVRVEIELEGDADLRKPPARDPASGVPDRAPGPGQRRPPCRRDDGDGAAHGR